jgi:hypothetical protein
MQSPFQRDKRATGFVPHRRWRWRGFTSLHTAGRKTRDDSDPVNIPRLSNKRATGFEPATLGLGSRCSTTELHPQRKNYMLNGYDVKVRTVTDIIDRAQDCDILFAYQYKGGMNMKYLCACIILCLLAACGQAPQDIGAADLTKQAKGFVDLLSQGDYTGAVARFDKKMQEVLSENQVEEMWSAIQVRYGQYQKQIGVRQTTEQGFDCVYVTCAFEKQNIDIKVVFDGEQKVAGLWFK